MRDIQISDHFDYSTMLLFSLPTIGTLVVDSTYVVADGFLFPITSARRPSQRRSRILLKFESMLMSENLA